MIARLWVPATLPSLNEVIDAAKGSGGRGLAYSKMKREWKDIIVALANRAHLPKFPGRVVFEFHWLEKDKRRDPDNIAATGRKFILDGLVKAGVLRGDSWKFVQGWSDKFEVAGAYGPGVAVTIQSYGE